MAGRVVLPPAKPEPLPTGPNALRVFSPMLIGEYARNVWGPIWLGARATWSLTLAIPARLDSGSLSTTSAGVSDTGVEAIARLLVPIGNQLRGGLVFGVGAAMRRASDRTGSYGPLVLEPFRADGAGFHALTGVELILGRWLVSYELSLTPAEIGGEPYTRLRHAPRIGYEYRF